MTDSDTDTNPDQPIVRSALGAHRRRRRDENTKPPLGPPPRNAAARAQERLARLRAKWEELDPFRSNGELRRNCKHPRYVLVGCYISSGAIRYYEACAVCGGGDRGSGSLSLPHRSIDPSNVEKWEDERPRNPPCQVCGAWGTELHHWAPRAIFGSAANHFPTSHLCQTCHRWWHAEIDNYQRQRRVG